MRDEKRRGWMLSSWASGGIFNVNFLVKKKKKKWQVKNELVPKLRLVQKCQQINRALISSLNFQRDVGVHLLKASGHSYSEKEFTESKKNATCNLNTLRELWLGFHRQINAI